MLKKMTLLAVAAAALVAFAVPASASAFGTHWTDNDVVVGNPVDITAPFEGRLKFDAGGGTTYSCEVTVKVTVTGPTTAEITEFNVTTPTCIGTGVFAGCELIADSNNVPWTITSGESTLTVTKAGGDITIHNTYLSPPCLLETTHLEFPSITVTPTLNPKNTITSLAISGTATTGPVTSGSVAPEGALTLGLKKV